MAHFGRLFDETEETLSVEQAMELLERCVCPPGCKHTGVRGVWAHHPCNLSIHTPLVRGARQLVNRRLAEERQQLQQSLASPSPFAMQQQQQQQAASAASAAGGAEPDMKFMYEEESDPGRFFVPYIWEVVVAQTRCVCSEREQCCCVHSSSYLSIIPSYHPISSKHPPPPPHTHTHTARTSCGTPS